MSVYVCVCVDVSGKPAACVHAQNTERTGHRNLQEHSNSESNRIHSSGWRTREALYETYSLPPAHVQYRALTYSCSATRMYFLTQADVFLSLPSGSS